MLLFYLQFALLINFTFLLFPKKRIIVDSYELINNSIQPTLSSNLLHSANTRISDLHPPTPHHYQKFSGRTYHLLHRSLVLHARRDYINDEEDDEETRAARDLFHRNPRKRTQIIDVEAEEVTPNNNYNNNKNNIARKKTEAATRNDATFVNENTSNTDKEEEEERVNRSLLKKAATGALDLAKSTAKAAFNGITSLLGKKPETPPKLTAEEEKIKAEIDQAFDEVFKGSGLFGSITKGILKSVLNSAAAAASEAVKENNKNNNPLTRGSRRRSTDENDLFVSSLSDLLSSSVTNSKDTIQLVQETVAIVIEEDPSLMKLFGFPLQSSRPVSQAISSMNINGRSSTEVSMQYVVIGSILSANVLTRGTVTGNEVNLQNIIIDFPTGERRDFSAYQINVTVRNRSQRGGGGRGGGGGGGATAGKSRRNANDDDIIDTEVL